MSTYTATRWLPAFAAISVSIAGCSSGEVSAEEAKADSDQRAISEAKAAVVSRLRDPSSAEFREVYINAKGFVCGSVNAKNGFGGYVGFSGFWYDPKTSESFLYDPIQDAAGKAYDAVLFDKKGCSIGGEQEGWLRTARMINESNRQAGLEPIGPEE